METEGQGHISTPRALADLSAAPDDLPPYWGKCEKMNYAQLRRFIHDAVERLSVSSVLANEELPSSQEELLALCDLLGAKAEALKGDTPVPERPIYDGPPDPGYFLPSAELAELYDKRERRQERVDDAIERGESRIYVEYLEDELEKTEQEVAPLEKSEREVYDERLRDYREAHEPHVRRVRSWRAEVEKVEKRREAEADRDEAVRRMYRKVERASDSERAFAPKRTGTLPWEIAAPGESTDDRAVRSYYREVLSRGKLGGFDQDRLDKMLALPYEDWLKGKAGFYGYIVLMFSHTEKVLMECPVRNNAIYVLDSGEERLLRMNKQELIASGEAKRIFHAGDWYVRLKQELGIE